MSTFTSGPNGFNLYEVYALSSATITGKSVGLTSASLTYSNGQVATFYGVFTVSNNAVTGGTVTGWSVQDSTGVAEFTISGANVPFSSVSLDTLMPAGSTYVGASNAAASDNLYGFGGSDTFICGAATETIVPGGGSNTIKGGSGVDTVLYSAASSSYQVTENGSTTTVVTTTGTDTLTNVDRIQFSDGVLVISTADPAAQVYRLYGAVLGRAPDGARLTYWAADITQQGQNLTQIANALTQSPEFQQRYGQLSDAAFVNQLYQNVLSRPADADGLQYWESQLAHGESRAQVVIGFSESTEYLGTTGSHFAHGYWLG